MKLSKIGEFGLIERFASQFSKDLPDGMFGIGDDCAVIPQGGSSSASFLVTTDLLLENVHFLKDKISPEELGYKSLAVNLSDIAAMGGTPLFCFLSIGLPSYTDIEWTDGFFKGFRSLAEKSGTLLMGGDTSGSKNGIVINVAVIGSAEKSNIKYRKDACPGDSVCITGMTGESAAGLHLILENIPENSLSSSLLKSHNCPHPHLDEGKFLGAEPGVHALMDISDGIDSDLRHILKKSAVSAEIDLESVPLSGNLKAVEKEYGIDPLLSALTGGEDYCLLLTADPEMFNDISRRFNEKFGHPLYRIGKITADYDSSLRSSRDGRYSLCGEVSESIKDGNKALLVYLKNGKPAELDRKGFDHFKAGKKG